MIAFMKLILTIENGSLQGQKFDLTNGFITIGRSENSSIRFDPRTEKVASKQHAFIEAKPDGFFISDNQSTNGTLVNGQRIQSAKLNNGDTIQFGTNGVTAAVQISQTSEPTSPFASENQKADPIIQFNQQNQAPQNNQAFGGYQLPQVPIEQNPSVEVRNSISSIGLSNIGNLETEKSKTGKYIGAGIAIFAFVFLGLVVIGLLVASLGAFQIGVIPAIIISVIAAVVAFVPAMFYLLPLVWLDRFDPEPLWLLASAFAWGAIVSVFVSFIINTVLGSLLGEEFGAVISAPIFEEGSKGLGLLILLLFFRKYFDGILDGLIFAGVIALGFATVENVLYYGRALLGGGIPGVAILFFIRGILSPFAHVTFTAMTGIGCGIARESHNTFVRILLPLLGYAGAVFLHALWNGVATFTGLGGFLLLYIVFQIPFFLIFVGFTFYIMYRQNTILREMLAIDVARGLIPQEHVDIATSAFRSFTWVWGGATQGKYAPRRKYLQAMGKLGLSYWHIQRATAAQGHTASFQQNPILREEVVKYRDKV